MRLTHGDLFSGIGGFALAAEAMGWQTRYFVENEPFAQLKLKKNFPDIPIHGDIKEVKWSKKRFGVDLITAGFPCQPVSFAGRQLGEEDARWLWPEVARCVAVVRPRYIVLENVPGLLVHGMGTVLGELSTLGYDAEWSVISAASVGANHLRNRVWIVGYPKRGRLAGQSRRRSDTELENGHPQLQEAGRRAEGHRAVADTDRNGSTQDAGAKGRARRSGRHATRSPRTELDGGREVVADAERAGLEGSRKSRSHRSGRRRVSSKLAEGRGDGAYVIPGGRLRFGSDQWGVEPDIRRVADGIPDRVERISALGNAVVPQVVVEGPFARIVQLEEELNILRRTREEGATR